MKSRGFLPTDPTWREKRSRRLRGLLHDRVRAGLTGIYAAGGRAICHDISTAIARSSYRLLFNEVLRGDSHFLGTQGYEVHIFLKFWACCEIWLNISIFNAVHDLLCNESHKGSFSATNIFIIIALNHQNNCSEWKYSNSSSTDSKTASETC